MYKGIYVAMTGSTLKMMQLENVANNLANASTNGFKKASFSSRLFPLLEGKSEPLTATFPNARSMAYTGKYSIESSQGMIQITGNPLDLAINGEGFFVVDANGNKSYTRNGSFNIDKGGNLITSSGYKVIGIDNKPINLGQSRTAPSIGADGSISVEGNVVATLKLVKVKDIQSVSDSLYSGKEDGPATQSDIKQGGLERSNVNPMRELVNMITAEREFQTIQQMIKSFDQLASESNQIAKI